MPVQYDFDSVRKFGSGMENCGVIYRLNHGIHSNSQHAHQSIARYDLSLEYSKLFFLQTHHVHRTL